MRRDERRHPLHDGVPIVLFSRARDASSLPLIAVSASAARTALMNRSRSVPCASRTQAAGKGRSSGRSVVITGRPHRELFEELVRVHQSFCDRPLPDPRRSGRSSEASGLKLRASRLGVSPERSGRAQSPTRYAEFEKGLRVQLGQLLAFPNEPPQNPWMLELFTKPL